jgi:organic hydroperoxide reductase OsmC/OhrA
MEHTRAVEVTSRNGRSGSVESADGTFSVRFGADSTGPSPEHLLAGAFAAAFHEALSGVVEHKRSEIPGMMVTVRCALHRTEHAVPLLDLEIRASMPGLSRTEARSLLHTALECCPYARLVGERGRITSALD